MSPQLGKTFDACIESGAARDGLLDFERFMHFSAGAVDKFLERYTHSDRDVTQQATFLGHLSSLAGVTELDEVVIDESTTPDMHRRVMEIHGIFLTETAVMDGDGVTQEVSYEASLVNPAEVQEAVPNPSAAA